MARLAQNENGQDNTRPKNFYEVLGVSKGASKAEIADAFRKLTPPGPAARPLREEDSGHAAILRAVSSPDETHRGGRGEYHALKRIDASHFVVVIYELGEGGGLIRTAFIINGKRKERRYKEP